MVGKRHPSGFAGFRRSERQNTDANCPPGEAAIGGVLEGIPDAPSYSAVRALINGLDDDELNGIARKIEDARSERNNP